MAKKRRLAGYLGLMLTLAMIKVEEEKLKESVK